MHPRIALAKARHQIHRYAAPAHKWDEEQHPRSETGQFIEKEDDGRPEATKSAGPQSKSGGLPSKSGESGAKSGGLKSQSGEPKTESKPKSEEKANERVQIAKTNSQPPPRTTEKESTGAGGPERPPQQFIDLAEKMLQHPGIGESSKRILSYHLNWAKKGESNELSKHVTRIHKQLNKSGGESAKHPAKPDLIKLMHQIESGARRGALVTSRDLRRAAGLPKEKFDQEMLELSKQGKVSLHKHDFPQSLSQSERDEMVTDGNGHYFVGAAIRQS